MKVALTTLGCRLNQFETMAIQELFERHHFEVVPFEEKADIYVINTCTVTAKSDAESRQVARKAIKTNKDAFIAVVGCYSQASPDEVAALQGVDLVLGNYEKLRIFDFLPYTLEKQATPIVAVGEMKDEVPLSPLRISHFSDHTRAFIKIQDGCNANCSFCLITKARGPSRSETPEAVIEQARELVDRGYKEIVVTGVNMGTYGRDLRPRTTLAALIEKIIEVNGLRKLRLSSIEPSEFSDELIDIIARSDRICRHFHIPLQSGDDTILRKMSRRYTSSMYADLIWKLNDRMPDMGLGADVMTGFPGESEAEFLNTYHFIESLPFTYLHPFTYSQRHGTKAVGFPDHAPEPEKKRRTSIIKRLGTLKALAFKERHLGQTIEALVENTRDPRTGHLRGITGNYLKVLTDGPDQLMNEFHQIKILELKGDVLYGEGSW